MSDKRNITLLVILLVIFSIIFFIALFGIQKQEALFEIGIPPLFENWLIIFLSVGSIARIVLEIYKE